VIRRKNLRGCPVVLEVRVLEMKYVFDSIGEGIEIPFLLSFRNANVFSISDEFKKNEQLH
jgi:hypothetical protein